MSPVLFLHFLRFDVIAFLSFFFACSRGHYFIISQSPRYYALMRRARDVAQERRLRFRV